MKLSDFQPPTPEDIAGASGIAKNAANDWSWYERSCRRSADVISSVLERVYSSSLSGKTALDWGSALGGVAITLNNDTGLSITAADVDRRSMDWLKTTTDSVRAVLLKPEKPLPFRDKEFEIVYGISVFTHIPPHLQEFYLLELKRILKDDGCLILTVKSYRSIDDAHNKKKNPDLHLYSKDELDRKGIHYASYPENVLKNMDFSQDADYGITYHSSAYVSQLFGADFIIETDTPETIGNQDVLVLRLKN